MLHEYKNPHFVVTHRLPKSLPRRNLALLIDRIGSNSLTCNRRGGPGRARLPAGLPSTVRGLAVSATRGASALDLDGSRHVEVDKQVGDFGFLDRFSLSALIQPRKASGTILSRMTDTDRGDGYACGWSRASSSSTWSSAGWTMPCTSRPSAVEPGQWYHVLVTYDGSRIAAGVRIYVDGKAAKSRCCSTS